MKKLFLALLGICILMTGVMAQANCPNGWDCVLTDILLARPDGTSDLEVWKKKNNEYIRNEPEKVLNFAEEYPLECKNKKEEYKNYCHKRKVLLFAAHNQCESIEKEAPDLNKEDRAHCKGFQEAFQKKMHCEGIRPPDYCNCLKGDTSYSESVKDPEKKEFFGGCRSAGLRVLFSKGGHLSCADRVSLQSVHSKEKDKADKEDCIRSSFEDIEKVNVGLENMEKIKDAESPVPSPQKASKNLTTNQVKNVLQDLGGFLEQCKDQKDADDSLGGCFLEKIQLLAANPIPGVKSLTALKHLFDTANGDHDQDHLGEPSLSGAEAKYCPGLVFATNSILNKVFTFDESMENSDMHISPEEKLRAQVAYLGKSDPTLRLIALKALDNVKWRVPESLPGLHLAASDPDILEQAKKANWAARVMKGEVDRADGKDPAFEAEQIKRQLQYMMWTTGIEAFARDDGLPGAHLIRPNLSEFVKDVRKKQKGDLPKTLQVLLEEAPKIVRGFNDEAKQYIKIFHDEAYRTCLNRPSYLKDLKKKYNDNRILERECYSWASDKLASLIFLRTIMPQFAPPDNTKKKYQEQMDLRRNLLSLYNNIASPDDWKDVITNRLKGDVSKKEKAALDQKQFSSAHSALLTELAKILVTK